MNTVQDVFDIAIRLMDSQNESTGDTSTADTKEYKLRTPSLINSILDRCLVASDTYADVMKVTEPGRRPVVPKVTNMEDTILLDERIVTGVMPYGLAGLLLSEENPALANFFWQTFLEQLDAARRNTAPAEFESIEDVYSSGGAYIEKGEFSHW